MHGRLNICFNCQMLSSRAHVSQMHAGLLCTILINLPLLVDTPSPNIAEFLVNVMSFTDVNKRSVVQATNCFVADQALVLSQDYLLVRLFPVYGGPVIDPTDALITGLELFCSIQRRPARVTLGHWSKVSFCSAGRSASLAMPKSDMGTSDRSRTRKLCISLMIVRPALLVRMQQQILRACEGQTILELTSM